MIFGANNDRLRMTAHGMPMHDVYLWLARKRFDGDTDATTYFVLRRHGMTAQEAWKLRKKGISARDAWKSLPPERLSLADRTFINATSDAIDETLRHGRRRRKAAQRLSES